ncbi:MAG TPA: pyrimidine reductase family protein [Acidimicrobiales bacterium]|nr:pyrimidine reductase family protein [Acidimicrobiales bacterium]
MQQLHPVRDDDVDVAACYLADHREPVDGRPWLAVNMATTLDGATALDGRSRGIGGPGDRSAFHALRSAADVILVGAGTARAENYGPVSVPDAHLEARAAAGRDEPARLAVISASGSLDPDSRMFSGSGKPPLVYTVSDTPMSVADRLADVAEVVVAGASAVDPHLVLRDLAARSVRCVVCEGGPHLNADLIAADVVDEWCWTIGPSLVGGDAHRGSVGQWSPTPRAFRLDRILTDGRDLLTRYLRE